MPRQRRRKLLRRNFRLGTLFLRVQCTDRNLFRLSQMHTMYSPTLNDAASTTNYPPANHLLSGPTTQMRRATFSACLPACSVVAVQLVNRRELELGPLPSNRGRDRTQIASSAMYSKMWVSLLPPPQSHDDRLTIHISSSDQRSSDISLCGVG